MKQSQDTKYKIRNTNHAPKQRVALVHDWLVGGGAELVVEQLHKMYPEAPIYTSYATDEWRTRLDNKVVTGWLQHLGKMRKYIPFLRIWWFAHLNLSEFDLVISSSGAEAKGIIVNKKPSFLAKLRNTKYEIRNTIHINYCHAPTHYYWSRYDEYMQHPGFGRFDWLARIGLKLLVSPLRKWDHKAAQRPDFMIANSTHTQQQIKQYYGRDSTVIHPPVKVERFQKTENQNLKRTGFVISGRQTPYKRFDLAVQACTQLNLPLTVIGSGPDNARLRVMAGPTITFVDRRQATDEYIEKAFASAEAFIFPGIDDFGITAVEAMAAGTPVIAYKAGGALDYIIPGKTGAFFEEQSIDSLTKALQSFNSKKLDSITIRQQTAQFNETTFQNGIQTFINNIRR